MKSTSKALKLNNLDILVRTISQRYLAYGPVAKYGEHAFQKIEPESDIYLGCAVTMLPAKHILQPVWQDLYTFKLDDGFKIEEPDLTGDIAIIGISPCDVHATLALDRVFGGKFVDPYYWERRKRTLIVAANCTEISQESFCTSWNTGPELYSDYDLLITDLADGCLLEVGSQRGADAIDGLSLPSATEVDLNEKAERLNTARASSKKRMPIAPDNLHQFFKERYNHPAWTPNADVCYSCGNCTFTCPTCYCFDVRDEIMPSKNKGIRHSEWNSCQLHEFAGIAHKANFRPHRIDRFKHRALHKLTWMKQKYGLTGCVGCGRCVRWCPSWPVRRGRITSLADPVEITADMMEAADTFTRAEGPSDAAA